MNSLDPTPARNQLPRPVLMIDANEQLAGKVRFFLQKQNMDLHFAPDVAIARSILSQ
jgi:hypothetical protein